MAGKTLIEVGYSVDGLSDFANEPVVPQGAAAAPAGTMAFCVATKQFFYWAPGDGGTPNGTTIIAGIIAGNWLIWPHQRVLHAVFKLPDATDATAYLAAVTKAHAQPYVPSAQPNCPRSVQVKTSGAGFTTTTAVVVTVHGINAAGQADTEDITITSAGGAQTIQGVKAWLELTNFTWTTPAGWSAGTFEIDAGTKLGLVHGTNDGAAAAVKEVGYVDAGAPPTPTDATLGTTDAANFTYTPTTALNGTNDVEVWYSVA